MSRYTPKFLLLGEILRPHGVRGELRMRVLTDHPYRIPELDQIYLGESQDNPKVQPYIVESMRMHQGYALLTLEGIHGRDAADRLRGLMVMIDLEHAVPLEEGEFYLFQLIGVNVVTEDGTALGTITDVLETGANDVYVVDSPAYGEVLIPVTEHTILDIDIDAEIVTVRLPDGLLPS